MNQEELEQKHLEYALGDAKIYFRNIPKLTRSYVLDRIVERVTSQFRGHEIPLFQFEAKEIDSRTYQVQVNNRSIVKMNVEREVCDA